MTRSAYLIFNPVAGQGDPDQDLAQILSLLTPTFDLTVAKTTEEVGADELARQAVERGTKIVIVAGGDGTISAAAGALVGTNVCLGIIARGTANAFASALGISATIEQQCQAIIAGYTRIIDTAICNDRAMLLLAAIGFEADTVEKANRQVKDSLGILAYILSGLQQLQEFETFEVEIETDDESITVAAAAVTMANAAPPTSFLAQGPAKTIFDDGLLDITIVAPKNRAEAISASYHLLQKAIQDEAVKRDDIVYRRTKQAKITAKPPQLVAVDGEVIGKTPITVKCLPQSLKIFVPFELAKESIREQRNPLFKVKVALKSRKTLWILGLFSSLLFLMLSAYFLNWYGLF